LKFLSFYRFVLYNQPKLCSTARWNSLGTTFANGSTVGKEPYGLFIDTNNSIYVAARVLNQVLMWPEGSIVPTQNVSGGLYSPRSVFVSINGDIYVANEDSDGWVYKWALNAGASIPVMNVTQGCYSLFIDINNTLYCSGDRKHIVIKVSLNIDSDEAKIVEGNGTPGSGSYMLNTPNGIFVNTKLNLYVADCFNHRVQLFYSGQRNGTTVAGKEASRTIALQYPTRVALDVDDNLFIADYLNNRIVGSGPAGFRCLLGCTDAGGMRSDQLWGPRALAFDSHGNMFVVDSDSHRIQKFLLARNSCGESYQGKKIVC
jgi:hypothetical protein